MDLEQLSSLSHTSLMHDPASSRLMRKEFSAIVNKFYQKPVFWSGSYSVISAGGAPLEVLKKYIRSQEQPKS